MTVEILLADDDEELCEELAEMLRDRHWQVHTVSEGSQVPDLIRSHDYDVILLDFKMPGLNGLEILRTIDRRTTKAKIFLMSGRPFLDSLLADPALRGLIAGRFEKPFDPERLLTGIESALGAGPRE